MPKRTSTTSEQLRALMQTHTEMAAAPVPAAPPTVVAPAVHEKPTVSSTRYSLRLLPVEIAKINMIIKNTVLVAGERTTLTDVLRVGLGRLGESAQISAAELALLRAGDRRRIAPR